MPRIRPTAQNGVRQGIHALRGLPVEPGSSGLGDRIRPDRPRTGFQVRLFGAGQPGSVGELLKDPSHDVNPSLFGIPTFRKSGDGASFEPNGPSGTGAYTSSRSSLSATFTALAPARPGVPRCCAPACVRHGGKRPQEPPNRQRPWIKGRFRRAGFGLGHPRWRPVGACHLCR